MLTASAKLTAEMHCVCENRWHRFGSRLAVQECQKRGGIEYSLSHPESSASTSRRRSSSSSSTRLTPLRHKFPNETLNATSDRCLRQANEFLCRGARTNNTSAFLEGKSAGYRSRHERTTVKSRYVFCHGTVSGLDEAVRSKLSLRRGPIHSGRAEDLISQRTRDVRARATLSSEGARLFAAVEIVFTNLFGLHHRLPSLPPVSTRMGYVIKFLCCQ